MNPFELLKPRIAIAPAIASAPVTAKRLYGAADYNRLTSDWAPTSTSADSEIVMSLRVLRNRSRQLVRDNEYAKNAIRQVQQNVIGTGIGLQPLVKNARGALIENLNDDIHEVFHDWWKDQFSVHTAGLMTGPDIERFLIGNLVESGEAFIRIVRQPFGDSKIPLAFELIESDRVMDQWTQTLAPNGNTIRMGVEMDKWHRPTAYWCWPVHPGDYQFATFSPSAFVRIPAEDMIHLYVVDRWPQSRGVPWFHAAMKRLNNMGGYEESEIIAARGSAAIMGFITSAEVPAPDDVVDGKRVDDMAPGQLRHLLPGETFTGFNPGRPNGAAEPFLRLMLRGFAAGVGMSYETVARDYSNTNYSSARAAQMEDRDLWRVLQAWFSGKFRKRVHREFMQQAVLANQFSIPDFNSNEQKYVRAHFMPRGWTWIDPTKEVAAYVAAVRAGFMTVGDVIGQTNNGRDADDVFKARRKELDLIAELNLVLDTDAAQVNKTGIAQPNTAPEEEVDGPAEPGEAAEPDPAAAPADPKATPAAEPASPKSVPEKSKAVDGKKTLQIIQDALCQLERTLSDSASESFKRLASVRSEMQAAIDTGFADVIAGLSVRCAEEISRAERHLRADADDGSQRNSKELMRALSVLATANSSLQELLALAKAQQAEVSASSSTVAATAEQMRKLGETLSSRASLVPAVAIEQPTPPTSSADASVGSSSLSAQPTTESQTEQTPPGDAPAIVDPAEPS